MCQSSEISIPVNTLYPNVIPRSLRDSHPARREVLLN